MFNLFPKEEKFFELFNKSSEKIVEGTVLFNQLLNNYTDIEEKIKVIKNIEHECDKITHECVEKLNKSFITPFDREDIHLLISKMDDILDLIDAAAHRLSLYKIKEIPPEFSNLGEILQKSSEELVKALKNLKNLKDTKRILDCCIEINRLENEGDLINRKAIAKLFDNSPDPLMVIKWKEIIEDIEMAIDKCEDVANIIEGIVLKNA